MAQVCIPLCFTVVLDPMASLEPDLHVRLLAVQSALSAVVFTVKKLLSGALPVPPSTTRSAGRRRRRQATLKKLSDASRRRSADLVDEKVQTICLYDAQKDVFEVPCAGESEAVVSEVSFPVRACLEVYRIEDPTFAQVDLFHSRSTVCALALPSCVSGFSDNDLAYGDACRLANVVNVVKDLLDRSLFGFEQTLGRGPSGKGAAGKPISKKQFVSFFNGSFTSGVGPTVASVSNVSAALRPSHASGHECRQQSCGRYVTAVWCSTFEKQCVSLVVSVLDSCFVGVHRYLFPVLCPCPLFHSLWRGVHRWLCHLFSLCCCVVGVFAYLVAWACL